jgi:hypothetical protein
MTARPATARAVLPLALAVLLGLLAAPGAAAPWSGRGGPRVEVEVRERPAEEIWEVRYRLPEAAAGVEFVRGRHAFRHELWGVAPAGSSWQRAGELERLCFPEPSRHLALSFRSDFTQRPKDHEINVRLGGGSRLLYTGHLLLRPLAACGASAAAPAAAASALDPVAAAPAAEPDPRHRFGFVTDDGRPVRVRDRSAVASLAWEPEPGEEETYALFGPATARESARATLVLDPGLPAWMAGQVESLLPRLFDRFAAETGLALSGRPLVLLGFSPEGSGRSFEGGVLHGVLAMSASGEGWAAETPEAARDWFVRLAHETFHFWGGAELLPDEESEWLSEAAAELFALRAAWGLEVLSYPRYEAALVDLANACLVGLDGGPLLAAPERRAFDTWTTCGPVLLFAADRAVERGSPGQGGIALLFRRMFEEGRTVGNRYGTGVFLGWLDKLSGERDTVHALQRLIRRGLERGADGYLHGLLTRAGLKVALVPPDEAADSPALRALLRDGLTRCACGTASPETSGDPDCARFAPRHHLGRVGGVEVRSDAPAAYGRFRSAALLGRPLEVVTGEEPQALTLLCPRDVLDGAFERLLRLEP